MAFPTVIFNTHDGSHAHAESVGAILTIESVLGDDRKVEFIAFLTDMVQTFNSTWNSEDVYGRNDPIATFQGTKRTISLSWHVPSDSLEVAKANLTRVSLLTQLLYPGYDSNNIIARPPLVKVKFTNLIQDAKTGGGLLGYIDSLMVNPGDPSNPHVENKNHYPREFHLSFNLNILHQHDLGIGEKNEPRDATVKYRFPFLPVGSE